MVQSRERKALRDGINVFFMRLQTATSALLSCEDMEKRYHLHTKKGSLANVFLIVDFPYFTNGRIRFLFFKMHKEGQVWWHIIFNPSNGKLRAN